MFAFQPCNDNPQLAEQCFNIGEQLTPAFLLNDLVNIAHWPRLYQEFPHYQLGIIDTIRQTVIGVVNTIPLAWHAPLSELPEEGWDWALANAHADGNWLCALLAAIDPAYRRQGLAQQGLRAAKLMGHELGHQGMLVPVRPTRKAEFVHLPMAAYLKKRNSEGKIFDPWQRLHLEMGAHLIKICHRAMTIQLSWAQWLEYGAVGTADELTIADGLVPIQRQTDGSGLYVEPNVWLVHYTRSE
jgi:GNAT superfamily N-acetyltransferase